MRVFVTGATGYIGSARAPRSVVYTSGVPVRGNTGYTPADESASTAGAIGLVAWRPARRPFLKGAKEVLDEWWRAAGAVSSFHLGLPFPV